MKNGGTGCIFPHGRKPRTACKKSEVDRMIENFGTSGNLRSVRREKASLKAWKRSKRRRGGLL